MSQKNNELICTWKPDPSYVPVLEGIADQQGIPVEQVAQNAMDYAVEQGWIYSQTPGVRCLFLNPADFSFLKETFQLEEMTGTSLSSAFRRVLQDVPAEEVAEEPAAAGKKKGK